ncbi:MAG: phosphoribosylformylglycinamidine synthase subunit PurS [Phycisphaerales bacterium]|nr:phosphoribosylformylglycinamidine synthase subunit PurS [Phycisphaerales bacterium]
MGLWRFWVSPKSDHSDPKGQQVGQLLADFGITSVNSVRSSRLFLMDLDNSNTEVVRRIADELLTDPVVETCTATQKGESVADPEDALPIEVHYKPGVMDNVAHSTKLALADLGIDVTSVRTARRYVLHPVPNEEDLAKIPRLLGNACIEEVVIGTKPIEPPPQPPAYEFKLRHIPIRNLDESGLTQLSREGHLFLSSEEMQAIQRHFQDAGRDPTDLELETLAQTWSEHCVHKTLKSAITYRGAPFPGREAENERDETTVHYDNLLSDTIARATDELTQEDRGPTCLSVFTDNAGVIAFDDQYGVAFKVETHNHPSAIEPYGGSTTGVGGVIRDVLGCGLGAKPIANTDVFCVAPPDWPVNGVPKGALHPKTVLKGVVAGVRDYGNRMGIPTVNGAVHFDPRYLGNPLVYCGCVGLIPRDRIEKDAQPGHAIVLVGGRTGRDGIHGATFSSAELTDTHEDEFAHAVQIGNAIEEKKVLDVILQARDYVDGENMANETMNSDTPRHRCLFSAITDCGAGGLSSAVGEMGEKTGAEVNLEQVPLKYSGLRYDEIWISEAQERMVLAVPPENVEALLGLAESEDVEATVIGHFTDTGRLIVQYDGTVVGDLDMKFLHDGLPKTTKTAEWWPNTEQTATESPNGDNIDALKQRLSHPTTASKHWIVHQYDHEVQAGSVVKPLSGKYGGPSDAAVVRPRLDSNRGIALGCGLAPQLSDVDPYWMTIAAIDEAVRNIVCVGGDPRQTAILDNFCWPASDDPQALGALVRSCQACYDAAKAYGLPFISGKDSLNNVFAMNETDAAQLQNVLERHYPEAARHVVAQQLRHPNKLSIPYTLLISAMALVEDVNRCISSVPQVTDEEEFLYYVGVESDRWDDVNLSSLARFHATVADLIRTGVILAAHDCSHGGVAATVAEMAFDDCFHALYLIPKKGPLADPFVEPPSGYVVQAKHKACLSPINDIPGMTVQMAACLFRETENEMFTFLEIEPTSETAAESTGLPPKFFSTDLRQAWRAPLDW